MHIGHRSRIVQLLRQSVALLREVVESATPAVRPSRGAESAHLAEPVADAPAGLVLADYLSALGMALRASGGGGGETEVCLREALGLVEYGGAHLTAMTIGRLINLSGEAGATVGPAEVEVLRLRLYQLLVGMGRSVELECSICLESLAPPGCKGASGGGQLSWGLRVLPCNHQFHASSIGAWRKTTCACPLCKA